jgi:ferredoxin
MKVRVNLDRCVGHGMCNLACPEVFKLSDEDGRAEVADENVPPQFERAVRQAVQGCPEEAIETVE